MASIPEDLPGGFGEEWANADGGFSEDSDLADIVHFTGYRCEECGTVHDSEWEAKDCCKPDVTQVETYFCKQSGTYHPTLEDAELMLSRDADEPDCTHHIAPEILERYGQLRLPLGGV